MEQQTDDIKQEKSASYAKSDAKKPAAPQQSGGRTILPAEKKFNWRVYGLLNYWVQVTTAVATASWIQYGGGKKHFEKAAEWTGEHILSKITKNQGAKAAKDAYTYLTGTALLMVGNFFLLPVKMLENRKSEIVRNIDNRMIEKQERNGYPVTPEQRRIHEQAHADLEKEPTTNWPTLIAARIAGFGSFYLSRYLIGEKADTLMQERAADGVQYLFKKSGVSSLEKLAEHKHTRNVSKTAFIDFFYSIFVASTVFQVTKMLTPKQKRSGVDTQKVDDKTTETTAQSPVVAREDKPASFAEKHARKSPAPQNSSGKFTDYVSHSANSEVQVSV